MVDAQPLLMGGKIISGTNGQWKEQPFNETQEVIVGYYHILSSDFDEAEAIAKANPEFDMDLPQELKSGQ